MMLIVLVSRRSRVQKSRRRRRRWRRRGSNYRASPLTFVDVMIAAAGPLCVTVSVLCVGYFRVGRTHKDIFISASIYSLACVGKVQSQSQLQHNQNSISQRGRGHRLRFFFNSVIFCLQYLLLIVLSLCLVECIIKTCSQPFMFLMLSVCDGLFIGGGTHWMSTRRRFVVLVVRKLSCVVYRALYFRFTTIVSYYRV